MSLQKPEDIENSQSPNVCDGPESLNWSFSAFERFRVETPHKDFRKNQLNDVVDASFFQIHALKNTKF